MCRDVINFEEEKKVKNSHTKKKKIEIETIDIMC